MKFVNKKLEEFNNYIKGKKVAIIGLGVSNIPLIDELYKLGANITLFNNKDVENLDKTILDKIYEYKLKFFFGENYLNKLVGFDVIFRSPSCRPDTPQIEAEVKRGALLTSEIELVLEMCPGTTIGITGSDGKTTTTSLIYQILKEQGFNCYLGGNIGIPLFTKIKEMKPEDYVVLELSSFQLMTMKVSPQIAVITNVTPNHLDIHKSYDEYKEAKANIFKMQNESDLLVLNYDNDITRNFAKEAKGNVVYFSSKEKLDNGIILDDGIIKDCENGLRRHIVNTKNIKLRGIHNAENICAAVAATKRFVSPEIQAKAVSEFSGVEHRLEFVKEVNNVKYYNDTEATNIKCTQIALSSFNEPTILILGGYERGQDFNLLLPFTNNVKTIIAIGETKDRVEDFAIKNNITCYKFETLKESFTKIKEIIKPGDIVLLSPASASWDQYNRCEERGDEFKKYVNAL